MLILGHIGMAMGAAKAGEAVANSAAGPAAGVSRLDYRFLAIGALLPDIVDKPLALFLIPELEQFTRSFGHTLLFPLLILALWKISTGRERPLMLALGVGSLLHLLMDGMWTMPHTTLWPLMGWGFEESRHTDFFTALQLPFHVPWHAHWVLVSELLGLTIVAHSLLGAWRRRRKAVRAPVPVTG